MYSTQSSPRNGSVAVGERVDYVESVVVGITLCSEPAVYGFYHHTPCSYHHTLVSFVHYYLPCCRLPLRRLLPCPSRREAETHFAMRHDNIVRLLAFSEGGPQRPPCMVMERMEESLSTFLEVMESPPPLAERLETTRDVCQVSCRLLLRTCWHCCHKWARR